MTATMIDSGAYSAWKRDQPIDLAAYIKFLKRFGAYIDVAVSLDVIPGERGEYEFDQQCIEAAAQQSYENHLRMKDTGLRPVPVYHQGDDVRWLHRYLDDGETYVGLSPYKRQGRKGQTAWLDE